MRECRIHDCHNPAETEDEYGPLCLACADALELADREEYEAAADEAEDWCGRCRSPLVACQC